MYGLGPELRPVPYYCWQMRLFSACFSPAPGPAAAADCEDIHNEPVAVLGVPAEASHAATKRVKFQLPESPFQSVTAGAPRPALQTYTSAANATYAQGHTLLLLDMDGQHMVWSNCSLTQANIQGNHHLACFTSTAEQGVLASLLGGSEEMAAVVLQEVAVHGSWKGIVQNLVADALLATHIAQQGHDPYASNVNDEAAMLQTASFTAPLSFLQTSSACSSSQLGHVNRSSSSSSARAFGMAGLVTMPSTCDPVQPSNIVSSMSVQTPKKRVSVKLVSGSSASQEAEGLGTTKQSVKSSSATDVDSRPSPGQGQNRSSAQAEVGGENHVQSTTNSPARVVRRTQSSHLRTQSVSKELMQVVTGCSQGPASQHSYSRFTTLLSSMQHQQSQLTEQLQPEASPQSRTRSLARKVKSSLQPRSKLSSREELFASSCDSEVGFPCSPGYELGPDTADNRNRTSSQQPVVPLTLSGRMSPGLLSTELGSPRMGSRDVSSMPGSQPGPKTSAMIQSMGLDSLLTTHLSTKSRASLTVQTLSVASSRALAPQSPLHKALLSNTTDRSTLPEVLFGSQNGYAATDCSDNSNVGNEVMMMDALLLGQAQSIGHAFRPSLTPAMPAPRVPSTHRTPVRYKLQEDLEQAAADSVQPSPERFSHQEVVRNEGQVSAQHSTSGVQVLLEEVPQLEDFLEPDLTTLRILRGKGITQIEGQGGGQNNNPSILSSFDHLSMVKSAPQRTVEVQARMVPLDHLPQGSPPLLLVSCTDISARRAAEQLLMQLTESQLGMVSQMFPLHVIEHLSLPRQEQQDLGLLARQHHDVTILFMDIVDFTAMSKEVEPGVVMSYLNEVFSMLDEVITAHNLHKVETAGDCYIVSSGVLEMGAGGFLQVAETHHPAQDARATIACAKAMLQITQQVPMPHNGSPTQIRIGIHTGDCTSGLIGSRLPKWSLYGDCVNTASRMESTSLPGRIQVTQATHRLLPEESWQATGGVYVKGKGNMNTYLWVPTTVREQHLLYGQPHEQLPYTPLVLGSVLEEAHSGSITSETSPLAVEITLDSPSSRDCFQSAEHSTLRAPDEVYEAHRTASSSTAASAVTRWYEQAVTGVQSSSSSSIPGRRSVCNPQSSTGSQGTASGSVCFVDHSVAYDRSSFLHVFGRKASQEPPAGSRAHSTASLRNSPQVLDHKYLVVSKASSWFRRSMEPVDDVCERPMSPSTEISSPRNQKISPAYPIAHSDDQHCMSAQDAAMTQDDAQAEQPGRGSCPEVPSQQQRLLTQLGTHQATRQRTRPGLPPSAPSTQDAPSGSLLHSTGHTGAHTATDDWKSLSPRSQPLPRPLLLDANRIWSARADDKAEEPASHLVDTPSVLTGNQIIPAGRHASASSSRSTHTSFVMRTQQTPTQPQHAGGTSLSDMETGAATSIKARRGSAFMPATPGDFSLAALMNAAAWKATNPPAPGSKS